MNQAFQDLYPEHYAQCYGCGALNENGLQIKSRWEGEESVCRFKPRPEHTAIPGCVYGGLLASLVDCHATGTSAAAFAREAGEELTTETVRRCVTAHLEVDYLKPTPMGVELELRARVVELKGRKVVVDVDLHAEGVVTVKGHAVCVEVPEAL